MILRERLYHYYCTLILYHISLGWGGRTCTTIPGIMAVDFGLLNASKLFIDPNRPNGTDEDKSRVALLVKPIWDTLNQTAGVQIVEPALLWRIGFA